MLSYADRIWLERRRKHWTRPDAYRFARPGLPEAKMPGYLHPWAAIARAEEAAADEARARAAAEQEEFEREVLALRHDFAKLKLEHELWLFEQKYSPSQPRVPAGSPQGGQWTSGAGRAAQATREGLVGNAGTEGSIDQPPPVSEPSSTGGAASDTDSRVIRVQMAVDQRPIYDKADSALLTPKGVNAASSEQKLKYTLDDGVDYLGGVTVINEDRTIFGRLAPSFGRSVVDVKLDAQIQTADGVSTSSFRIQRELTPSSSITIPWKEFGLLRGPGQVEITASNMGALSTGVIIGARRVQ